jgi:hypothetical protein
MVPACWPWSQARENAIPAQRSGMLHAALASAAWQKSVLANSAAQSKRRD